MGLNFSALRSRNRQLSFGESRLSLIATWMMQIATIWLLMIATSDTILQAIIGHQQLRPKRSRFQEWFRLVLTGMTSRSKVFSTIFERWNCLALPLWMLVKRRDKPAAVLPVADQAAIAN